MKSISVQRRHEITDQNGQMKPFTILPFPFMLFTLPFYRLIIFLKPWLCPLATCVFLLLLPNGASDPAPSFRAGHAIEICPICYDFLVNLVCSTVRK